MKLKDTINTVISHNAHVSLDIKDKNEPWFSPSVYPWNGACNIRKMA